MPLAAAKAALKSAIKAVFDNIGDPTQDPPVVCPTPEEKAAEISNAIKDFITAGIPMTIDSGQSTIPFVIGGVPPGSAPAMITIAQPVSLSGMGGIDSTVGVGMATVQPLEAASLAAILLNNSSGTSEDAATAVSNAIFNIYSKAQVMTSASATWPAIVPHPVPPPAGPAVGPFTVTSTQGGLDTSSGSGLDTDGFKTAIKDLFANVASTNTAIAFSNDFTSASVDYAKTAKVETNISGSATCAAVISVPPAVPGIGATTPPLLATGTATGTIS